jgi:hypothetical protein
MLQRVLAHNVTLWARGGKLDGLQEPYFRRKLIQEPIICVPGLLVTPLHHREYQERWRQQGGYVKSKLEKTACFIVAESLDTPPEHTHVLSAAFTLPRDTRG